MVLVCISLVKPLFTYLLVLYFLFHKNACSKPLLTFLFFVYMCVLILLAVICVTFDSTNINSYVVEFILGFIY